MIALVLSTFLQRRKCEKSTGRIARRKKTPITKFLETTKANSSVSEAEKENNETLNQFEAKCTLNENKIFDL